MASLSMNLYGHELRAAPRSLDRLDSVFGCEPSHKQCQLTVGCRLEGSPINPLHVFRGVRTATVHFHNKFGVLHEFSSRSGWQVKREARRAASHFSHLLLVLRGLAVNL